MTKNIDMYCSFNKDGAIIPIQFRIEDENGELQTFKVKRWKEPKVRTMHEKAYHSMPVTHLKRLDYTVVIDVMGFERIVTVSFHTMNHTWEVTI